MPDSVPNPRDVIATALRDLLHETPMSVCNMGSDSCGTWPLAFEWRDVLFKALAAAGLVVVPSDLSDEDIERACAAEWGENYWPGHPDIPNADVERRYMRLALTAFLAPYQQTEDSDGL